MSHPGTRGFYNYVTDVDTSLAAMRQAWYRNDWREMAARAYALAEVAATIASEATEMAEREQPHPDAKQ